MNRWRSFAIGVIFGAVLIGGAGYAADEIQIPVSFPDIRYYVDGDEVGQTPTTIRYEEAIYIPVRFAADILGKEIAWDIEDNAIHLNSAQPVTYERVDPRNAPDEIVSWLERSQDKKTAQVRYYDDSTYILVTRGAKPSGGYDVQIDSIHRNERGMWVHLTFLDPPRDHPVTEEMTQPYALLKLDEPYFGPIKFRESQGKDVSDLEGMNYLPPVYKETDHMLVFEPETEEGAISLRGAVKSFEGAVLYTLHQADGEVIDQAWINSEGSMTQWGYFETPYREVEQGTYFTLQTYAADEEWVEEKLVVHADQWLERP